MTSHLVPPAAGIWLAIEPVDMRLGIDGLSARIQASLGRSPCDGTAYAFTNRKRSRLKLLICAPRCAPRGHAHRGVTHRGVTHRGVTAGSGLAFCL